jgi:ATP-binding cassette subfamily F protein uup
MSQLILLDNVQLAFGLDALLENVKLQISAGERVCLIGRNGAGKSSLLKIIDGSMMPDSGQVWRKPNLRIARLEQELPQNTHQTIYDYVAAGLAETGQLLSAYHELTHSLSERCTEQDLLKLEKLQQKIDAVHGWDFEQNIKTVLTRLELNPDQRLEDLSGGWQRRTALAKALVSSPELLLLDEPTNHLDISAIQWLEDQLMVSNAGILFITHDRSLLRRLATRIIELDRGQLSSWPGDYDQYLIHKEECLHAEERGNAEFDKKLAQEERWIRQGVKARRTRNEGRVRALEAMRMTRAKRRLQQGKVSFNLTEGEQSGKLVVEAEHISHQFDGKPVIKDFSVRIMRGDRIGFIGPNGVGKTTLINILLGRLQPDQGTLQQGTKWQVAYFDQLRMALDPEKTVIDNVAEGRETIELNGRKQHIISYLGDFLFTPKRALTQVKALSGGECNRLLLARLFSQPANILVLDEPTNDLDIETLELLEELLANYDGTLLLVSHDRSFVDNVVTSILVFDGQGHIDEYIGGYQDWLRYAKREPEVVVTPEKKATVTKSNKLTKLSYKDQKELEESPKQIEKLEAELLTLQENLADPEFYKASPEEINLGIKQVKDLEERLSHTYKRWEELESLRNSLK